MTDEDDEFRFSGKEPRLNKEPCEELIKSNQGKASASKENKETK